MRTCIHTLVLNEHLFIKEWVDYHLNLGFDTIFIYEDYGSKSHKDIFKDYDSVVIRSIKDTNINKEYYNSCTGQIQCMKLFLKELKNNNEYDWCLFCDCDEFLMFEDGYDLYKLLNEFKDYAGIWLAWKMYNANGHIKRPTGNVVDNYTNVIEFKDRGIDGNTSYNKKSFVNIKLAKDFKTNHIIFGGVDTEFNNKDNAKKTYSKAWLNHYFSKSWEDFCDRMINRGNMGNSNRNFDQFFKMNPEMKNMRDILIKSVRYKHMNNVQYISKNKKLISGGNVHTIKNVL